MQGNRKVIFGFVLLAIGIAMDRFVTGGLSANLLDLMKFLTMGFFAGNAVEHVTSAVVATKGDVDGDGDADEKDAQLEEVKANLATLSDATAQSNASLNTIQQVLQFIIQKAGFNK